MHADNFRTEVQIEAGLRLAEVAFAHLDLAGSTVRQELAQVNWGRSVGVFDASGRCVAQLLVADSCMLDHLQEEARGDVPFDPEPLRDLRGLRGDSLIILPEARRMVPAMFQRLRDDLGQTDYLWGTAHEDLQNLGFWQKHATILGAVDVGTHDHFFVVPLTGAARDAVEAITLPAGMTPR